MRTIRPAGPADVAAVARIYDEIHTEEEQGRCTVGWDRAIYPTLDTARRAQADGELYVLEEDGVVAASARFNQHQEDAYAQVPWRYPAAPEQVYVMHTLVVSPAFGQRGCAADFIAWYERRARTLGCTALRIDTNARNARARRMYARLGFREAGVIPCVFNGIGGVELVCLEKAL